MRRGGSAFFANEKTVCVVPIRLLLTAPACALARRGGSGGRGGVDFCRSSRVNVRLIIVVRLYT